MLAILQVKNSETFKIDNAGPAVVLSNDISGRTQVKNGTTVKISAAFTDAEGTAITVAPTIGITNGGGSGTPISTSMTIDAR